MLTLADIAALLDVPLPAGANPAALISGVAALGDAGPADLSFASADAFAKGLAETHAAAVVIGRRVRLPSPPPIAPIIVVDDADLAVAKVLAALAPPIPRPPAGVDASARVAASATLGEGTAVGPNVIVGERVALGRNVVLHAGVFIGDDVCVGDDSALFANVVVRERIAIGSRVTIHAGSVLGTDGFGYRWDGRQHVKVPQIGTVTIEDDVEIGSCVCIDRAKFGTTRVGQGSKIDNLVQIGHNAQIGPHCIVVGQAGLAGSVKLGAGVVLGGQSAVRDHITMGDGAMLAACSGIMEDVEPRAVVSGLPALPHRQSLREQGALRKLPDLVVQVRKLTERLEKLEARGADAAQ